MIKLNGGLATSMGLQQPKSLLEAREGQSFLDVIVGQTLALRRRFGIDLPLVLMDSEATRAPTLEALAKHRELAVDELPADFLQSMISEARRRNARAGHVGQTADARVVPARPRGRVQLAARAPACSTSCSSADSTTR